MADPRQASWGHVLDTVLNQRLRTVHTAMMGEIRAYSEADQTAEVTLAVQLENVEGEFETLPPLSGVPVLWPGAWEAGDRCLLVFCEESFAKWFDTGSVEPPEVLRRHGLHAVCIPLVAPAGEAVDFVALAAPLLANYTQLKAGLDIVVGKLNLLDSSATAAWDLAMANWPTSVASTKVKAR
jgi:hypothetical protein